MALAYYVGLFVLPLMALIAIRAWAGRHADAIFAAINGFLESWGRRVIIILLLGLGANYLFGFWQADPIVGLIIVAFLFREGVAGWKETKEN